MSPQLQDALGMFAFLAIELSVLFIGISLLVGVLQRHIPPSKVEALLTSSGKRGYFLAAGLGAITPFCSCSTVPMLKGLIRARAGFGPMMVFLFSSPLHLFVAVHPHGALHGVVVCKVPDKFSHKPRALVKLGSYRRRPAGCHVWMDTYCYLCARRFGGRGRCRMAASHAWLRALCAPDGDTREQWM